VFAEKKKPHDKHTKIDILQVSSSWMRQATTTSIFIFNKV